jgi:hypothetical protein
MLGSGRVIVDNLPPREGAAERQMNRIHSMFHSFNVICTSRIREYKSKHSQQLKWLMVLDFETPDEANEACKLYDGDVFDDYKLSVAIAKPPMRQIAVSSENGYAGYHNSLRDTGSAVGTNFEKVRSLLVVGYVIMH